MNLVAEPTERSRWTLCPTAGTRSVAASLRIGADGDPVARGRGGGGTKSGVDRGDYVRGKAVRTAANGRRGAVPSYHAVQMI